MPIGPCPIRPYPWWFTYVPLISKTGFNTLFTDTIYLSKDLYIDSQRETPDPVTVALIKHQEVHAHGASLWKAVRFVCSPTFRLQEEKEAYTAQFHHLKAHHRSWDLERVALYICLAVKFSGSSRFSSTTSSQDHLRFILVEFLRTTRQTISNLVFSGISIRLPRNVITPVFISY